MTIEYKLDSAFIQTLRSKFNRSQREFPVDVVNTWASKTFEGVSQEKIEATNSDNISLVFNDFIRYSRNNYPPIPGADTNDGKFHESWELYPQSVDPTTAQLETEITTSFGSWHDAMKQFIDGFIDIEEDIEAKEASLVSGGMTDMGQIQALRTAFDTRVTAYKNVKKCFE